MSLSGMNNQKNAFTLTEVMIAVTLSGTILAAIFSIYIWCGKISCTCEEKGWSQNMAMVSSEKIMTYIKNASAISGIDTNQGNWVAFSYPDGTTRKLVYTQNPTSKSGALAAQIDGGSYTWFANAGITNNMKIEGVALPIFSGLGPATNQLPNAVKVQYQVTKPTPTTNSEQQALNVSFVTCLRNCN